MRRFSITKNSFFQVDWMNHAALVGLLLLLVACGPTQQSAAQESDPTQLSSASTATPLPTPGVVAPAAIATPIQQLDSPTVNPTLTPLPAPPTNTIDNPTAEAADANQTVAKTSGPPSPTPTETPVPTNTPAAATPPPLEALSIKLISRASGFTKPVYLTHAGDGSGRLFVVEQAGRILILKNGIVNPEPFLDIESLVGSDSLEQGLLSVAFHPDYANNGLFFVNYTNKQGDTVISRYSLSANPDQADANSATVLLTIDQPYANHNGGQLAFGPDGFLYVGMGDGGAAGDPHNNGQRLDTLLGKILRLDVDTGDPYGIPPTNPFVSSQQGQPEIWSYGWRNPWRFSFDRANGDIYLADVGQNQYEEVHVELAGTPGGQNYGWRWLEGSYCFESSNCDPASLGVVLPVAEYDHSQGCSITGGYVYRGQQFPALTGVYFYGDFCSGLMWGLRREANGSWSQAQLLASSQTISSFGQDETGELYVLQHQTGEIFQLGN
jgi:glucose/arabinose dehydrogenase